MLEEKSFYLWEKQTELGHIGVRRVDLVLKDGSEIARSYHRHLLSPGDDISMEVPEIQEVVKAVWTPEVIEAYKAYKEKING